MATEKLIHVQSPNVVYTDDSITAQYEYSTTNARRTDNGVYVSSHSTRNLIPINCHREFDDESADIFRKHSTVIGRCSAKCVDDIPDSNSNKCASYHRSLIILCNDSPFSWKQRISSYDVSRCLLPC